MEKLTIAHDSCNGYEQEFAAWLRDRGYSVEIGGRISSENCRALWDEFCRS